MEDIFRGIGTDGIPSWLWDPRITRNGKSIQMAQMLIRLQHNDWDLGG